MTSERDLKVLCECGHALGSHQVGGGRCYCATRKTERKKDQDGIYVKVKCVFCCYCDKFKERVESKHG